MKPCTLLFMLALALTVGCGEPRVSPSDPVASLAAESPAVPPGRPVEIPAALIDFLRTADDFRLFIVVFLFDSRYETMLNGPKVYGYPILEEAEVTKDEGRRMAEFLGDPSLYLPEGEMWTCLPHPEYVLRARRGEAILYIVLHKCRDVEMIAKNIPGVEDWSHGLIDCRLCELFHDKLSYPADPGVQRSSAPPSGPK